MDNISYITNETGEKTAIVLPIAEYEDMLEDIEDLKSIAGRKNEPSVSLSDFKNSLDS